MPRRFALDQNFPEPIVDGLADWLAPDAELVPIRRIDARMATLDDWEVLAALHADETDWDGLTTTDAKMLSLPRELAVMSQTRLTLVVAEAVGHDPIKATGLILAHLGRICEQTRPDVAQVWRLRTSTKPADVPGATSRRSPSGEAATRRSSTRGSASAGSSCSNRPSIDAVWNRKVAVVDKHAAVRLLEDRLPKFKAAIDEHLGDNYGELLFQRPRPVLHEPGAL